MPSRNAVERRILLVEDNYADVLLLREALRSSKHHVTLNVVTDGKEALDYLRHRGTYASAADPDLVLLDLNLRKMNGSETLQEIRRDPELSMLPVVIMTGSNSPSDIVDSYLKHANGYVVKPVGMEQLCGKIEVLLDYWFDIVELPRRNGTRASPAK
jgi:CheY-like chemotaxis protein